MKTWPTLYKKGSGGAVQQWKISVVAASNGALIVTEHGQVGGKLQTGEDLVTEGKNPGKKNETTPIQQAEREAEAEWKKKQERKGYVESLERAQAGENDFDGGISPMLAQTYDEDLNDKHKVFPAHGQRKLNGVRCLVHIDDGVVTLWSRQHTPILGVPHVQKAYEDAFQGTFGHIVLDGELYRHGWSLQKISGYVRKEKTKPGFEQISHNVYDVPVYATGGIERVWAQRQQDLDHVFKTHIGDCAEIKKVETVILLSEEHLNKTCDAWIQDGYEGLMYRHTLGTYQVGKRSYFLLKVKRWKDDEFEIIAVTEGRGKFAGKAMFTCLTLVGRDPEAPKEFDVCAPGNFEDRENYFKDSKNLIGKHVTVKYHEWTEEKKPFLPVGMVIRDYE